MNPELKIVLLVLLPLIWGLTVEFVFERLRRRRARKKAEQQIGQANS
jgi:hypothetical protein